MFLLEVFGDVVKKKKNSILLLIGIGDLKEKLIAKAEELGIREKVIFFGSASNVNELMQAMDVFVMTSLHEGLPVVGIEAQAAGLPCVLSDVITRETAILDTVSFINLKQDIHIWSDVIISYSKKNYERKEGTEKIIEAGFDIQSVANDLYFNYLEILNNKQ